MPDESADVPAPARNWRTLAQSMLESEETPPDTPPDGMEFGDYHLEEEIARGGMGIVYRAWQVSLSRAVAVKVMREGLFADARDSSRFRQEAAAAAALRHPGIVPVYECGEHEGRLFYAMEWIAGPNLAEVTREHPAGARQAAQWVREVADAMEHAHGQGVIHRDLKPANVLLDEARRARVTDFGMAQREDTASGLTLSGQMLGTPGYMAPEAARGNSYKAGAAVDVYGLGALLFHLLTGRAPFVGESTTAVLQQLANAEPVAPRLLNPSVPRDLETICLKALSREPARRYVTAHAMAEDLARFLKGEPIHARPVSAAGKLWKWCRRKPALAASFAAVLLLAAGLLATFAFSARRIEGLRREAVERLYASDMRLALQNIAEGRYGTAAALVERHQPGADGEDLRGFEWRLARELCRSGERAALEMMDGQVRTVAISPNGLWLAAGADNLRVWELQNGHPLLRSTVADNTRTLAFSPDSRRLAVSFAGGDVAVFDPAVLKTALFTSHAAEPVTALEWRRDGSALEMIAGRQQLRWSPEKSEADLVAELPAVPRQPFFSSDGRFAGFLHEPAGAEAWRFMVREMTPPRTVCDFPVAQDSILRSFTFSSDGQWLATGDYSGRIVLRPAPFDHEAWDGPVHRGKVTAIAFSPDGTQLATTGDQVIRLMDVNSHSPAGILRGHHGMIDAVAISPDRKHVLSGDQDGAVKWWDTPAARKPDELPDSAGVITSSDGALLSWAGGEKGHLVLSAWGGPARVTRVELGGNGICMGRTDCFISSRSAECRSALHLTMDGPPEGETIPLPGPLERCSQDGRWLVIRSPETNLLLLLDRTGQQKERVLGDEARPSAPAFSDDGSLCAMGFRTGEVRVIATATGAPVCRIQAHRTWAYTEAFSHDGKTLATAGFDGKARLWNVATGKMVREFDAGVDTLWCVALSPDGSRIAAGTSESTVILWDTANGLETGVVQLGPPQNLVEALAFTPDGKALLAHGHVLRAP